LVSSDGSRRAIVAFIAKLLRWVASTEPAIATACLIDQASVIPEVPLWTRNGLDSSIGTVVSQWASATALRGHESLTPTEGTGGTRHLLSGVLRTEVSRGTHPRADEVV